MNAIIGMTSIGKNTGDAERKDYALKKIEDASTHLLNVINDVLDMSKIEANKMELSLIEFNFEKMLQKVVMVLNFRMDEKQQRFSVNVDGKVPRFLISDDQRLSQVITNLLSNAVKFTPEGGNVSLGISLAGEENGVCELRIEVADSGIGISPEQKDKLFGAFEQAESSTSRKFGGTGLGLAISKRIVELMGGRIWVESELGEGARFIFTVKAERGKNNIRSLLNPGLKLENTRVLAVDDEKDIRRCFNDLFEPLGVKCDIAADGFEACRMIEQSGEYDIYFIDWRMPGMDGMELTKRIKSRTGNKPSVVIMISSVDWTVIKDEALEAGVDKYLLKPLFSSAIIDCVNECFGIDESGEVFKDIGGEFAGIRILLAEDIEINREIVISLLDGTGLIIDTAENGRIAFNMIEEAPDIYDLVFMDMQMPEMDGLEATRRIRALSVSSGRRMPIIAMTANVFKDDVEACIAAGMDDHIGKPLEINEIFDKLRKYLKRGR
jgi:CheY-like chemotaxis protein/two-component sensor histidine kinase